MSIDALIFDVDGTLADTEEVHRVAFNLAFTDLGLGWEWSRDEYRRLLGVTGGKERLAHYIEGLRLPGPERRRLLKLIPEMHARKTRFYTACVADGALPLRDGVARLLEEARSAGCLLAIASTTTAANIEALLEATLGTQGLDFFNVIACGDQVRAKKPAPDIYELALHGLSLRPEHAIAFEDSTNGLRAATRAGLPTVVTPTYWTEGGDFADALIVLPRLGDPANALPDEPGGFLQDAGWLSFDELVRIAARTPASSALS